MEALPLPFEPSDDDGMEAGDLAGTDGRSTASAARVRLGAFIRDELLFDRSSPLADDGPLLRGRIDSVGLMELLTYVEDEFGVILNPDDIDEEHFGTIDRLARLVEEKLAGA